MRLFLEKQDLQAIDEGLTKHKSKKKQPSTNKPSQASHNNTATIEDSSD